MPRPVLLDVQPAFRQGLNTSADESQLKPEEVRTAENARLTEYGGVTKRFGSQRVSDSPVSTLPILAGFTWRKTVPASHLAVADGHLYHAQQGPFPWTWVDGGSGLDPTRRPSLASFRDISADVVYIADGGGLNKWDSGTLTLDLGATPAVRRLAVFNQRLWGCGDPLNPETLYHSGLQNGDTLGNLSSGGGATIIRTFAHEPLSALLPVGNSLLLFHDRGISRFTGSSQDDFDVQTGVRGVTQDVGTIAPDSVVGVENVGFFASDRGIYAATESGVQAISPSIEQTLAQVNATDLALISAVHRRLFREVWFAIPNLGTLVYNYRLKAWSGPYTGLFQTVAPCVLWESGAGSVSEVYLGGTDGIVRQADIPGQGLDDVLADGTLGDVFTLSVQLHRMFYRDPMSEKSLRFLYVLGNLRGSSGSSIQWETGDEAGQATLTQTGTTAIWGVPTVLWGAADWGAGGSVPSRVHAYGRGRYNDIRLVDSGSSNPVFSRVEAHAFDMGRRF